VTEKLSGVWLVPLLSIGLKPGCICRFFSFCYAACVAALQTVAHSAGPPAGYSSYPPEHRKYAPPTASAPAAQVIALPQSAASARRRPVSRWGGRRHHRLQAALLFSRSSSQPYEHGLIANRRRAAGTQGIRRSITHFLFLRCGAFCHAADQVMTAHSSADFPSSLKGWCLMGDAVSQRVTGVIRNMSSGRSSVAALSAT
jgi:hypothetical protein